ncbi:hypothetical protein ACVWZK_006439 [Bradyrhizobium sp. GM0.4]
MNDEELLTQAAAMPTVYVDGFGAFRKINGVLRCVGYVIGSGAQLNLIISLSGAESSIIEAKRTLEEKPVKTQPRLDALRLTH